MSTIKVDTLDTRTGTGNITLNRPLVGDGSGLTSLSAANLTGTLPAISGASLTNLPAEITKQATDPTVSTNPSGGVGTVLLNNVSGEMFICTDATAGSNIWTNVGGGSGNIAPFVIASGGTVTTSGNYKIHTFTGDGTFTVTQSGPGTVESLIIAGGGGGGGGQMSSEGAGGGGAGGYRNSYGSETSGGGGSSESALSISIQAYSITVGAGGAAGPVSTNGSVGANSVFSTIISQGGGFGGKYNNSGSGGGSGGGGGESGQAGGLGTSNQGYAGGAGGTGGHNGGVGGGGGGASAVGGAGSNSANTGGNGSAGVSSSITGSAVTRAGGGGGSSNGGYGSPIGGTGGAGGGGAGSNSSSSGGATGGTGTTNTGSGGGGGTAGSGWGTVGGAGGSGLVIIRYQYQ